MKVCHITNYDQSFCKMAIDKSYVSPLLNIVSALGGTEFYHGIREDFSVFEKYDVFILCMSKTKSPYEKYQGELAVKLKTLFPQKKLFLVQDGERGVVECKPISGRIGFYRLIQSADVMLCHNQKDADYYSLFRDKPTIVAKSVLAIPEIQKYLINPETKKEKIILTGGSFDWRTNGLTGLLVCRKWFPDYKLLQFSRMVKKENDILNREIKKHFNGEWESMDYVSFYEWTRVVSKSYVALHLMSASGACRTNIILAALGIPTIAVENDYQNRLFPDLVVGAHDVISVKDKLNKLLNDKSYYDKVRQYALDNVVRYDYELNVNQVKDELRKVGYDF